MAKKLFVGNLSWGVDDQMLYEAFKKFGEIANDERSGRPAANVVMDREIPNRSRGFGFVTFVNDADGDTAVREMNGVELDGRALTVNEARPREEN